jgi:uncharacterized protein (DUF4415 family)
MSKIVRKTIEQCKPSAREIRRVAALAARPDSEIDFSDIPELEWKHPIPNPFYRPIKKQLTVRLDADVIAWLRQQGKGYQTRLNAILRSAMLQETAPKGRRAS